VSKLVNISEAASLGLHTMALLAKHGEQRATNQEIAAALKGSSHHLAKYNEKFAKPGKAIMGALKAEGLTTATSFDEEIEWTWFYLWHHEGRRSRHGASMMAP